jgi:hypothetical protein
MSCINFVFCLCFAFLTFFSLSVAVESKPKASHFLGKHSTSCPSPFVSISVFETVSYYLLPGLVSNWPSSCPCFSSSWNYSCKPPCPAFWFFVCLFVCMGLRRGLAIQPRLAGTQFSYLQPP